MSVKNSEEKKYPSLLDVEEWMKYRRLVTETCPQFFANLSVMHPGLTEHEVKLCSLFLFECETNEIAERLGKISNEWFAYG